MANRSQPGLGTYMAERALREYFQEGNDERQEQAALFSFCWQALPQEQARKVCGRLLRMEVNDIIVDAVLQSQTGERQRFIAYKYRDHRPLVQISIALNVSLAQLNVWNREILEQIRHMLLLRLTAQDVFCRTKVINMVEVLQRLLAFFDESGEEYGFVDTAWLEAIRYRHRQYRRLLRELDRCLYSGEQDLRTRIVAAQIQYPHEIPAQLSVRLHINKGIISRHLNAFQEAMRPYIE